MERGFYTIWVRDYNQTLYHDYNTWTEVLKLTQFFILFLESPLKYL